MLKTATLVLFMVGPGLADNINLIRERDARAVVMEHREVAQAQPVQERATPAPHALVIPKHLHVSRKFRRELLRYTQQ